MEELDDEEEAKRRQRERVLSVWQVLGFIARQWLRLPGRFAGFVTLMLVSTLGELSIPWAAGGLIGAVASPAHVAAGAWRAWAMLSGLYLFVYLVRNRAFRTMNTFAARNMEALTNDAFARVQSFSTDWYADTFAGATVRRVSRAMNGYDTVSDALFLMLGPSLLVLFGLSISMGLRWPLAGVFCGCAVLLFMAYNLMTSARLIRPLNLKSNAFDTRIGAALSDAISGNAVVKSFGAEDRETARFAQVTLGWRVAVIRTWNAFNLAGLGQNMLLFLLQAGLTGLLVWAWAHGQATPGDVGFAITSFMLMSGYMRNFSETARNLQKGLDDVLDVAAYMQTPPQVADAAAAPAYVAPRSGPRGGIVFDRVTFRYKGQARPIYDRFSLDIAPGGAGRARGPHGVRQVHLRQADPAPVRPGRGSYPA